MQLIPSPVMPKGFSCASKNCGIKAGGKNDLSLFYSEVPAAAAAMFTRNQVPGAPVIVGRELIKKGQLQGIVVNSKVSNVGTGEAGVANARRMGLAAAKELGVSPELVLMSSTGVIAVPLPIEKIEAGVVGMKADLVPDPMLGALGIMTTDSYPKACCVQFDGFTITIIGKGSGMIEPNMATMLVYAFTDAQLSSAEIDSALRKSVHITFNMLSVDTDTSTSDTCVILANGLAGRPDLNRFQQALDMACTKMVELLARDGEGATKMIKADIVGAVDEREARIYARSIISSPLIKTMAYGADPNIGRLLMALGKCFDNTFDLTKLRMWANGILIYENCLKAPYDDAEMRKSLSGDPIIFRIDLGLGAGQATAYGCDFTEGYITENAAYYSS
ncbi:MAG: Arginine biosynthesis bifunctional protein [Verrucomicrobiota bacterium]|jgi:glutamate N-acetyltransferase/amino-acid N-acetyltransferase